MHTRYTYLEAIKTFNYVATEIQLNENLIHQAKEYENLIREFRVLVPIVGSFNVGKTSLINAYLNLDEERELPTGIVPTTSLATEIHQASGDGKEKVEIFDSNGGVKEYDLKSYKKLEKIPEEASFAKAYLQSDELNSDKQITLIDMPGLDSGTRPHNLAIQRYLPLGSYFILVLDIERGTLKETELLQLQEFLIKDVESSIFLNKADRKRNEELAVTEHVKEQANTALDKQIPVNTVSALSGDIDAFAKVLNSIDPELAMQNYWRQRIIDLFDLANISLHTRYNAINFSSSQVDKQINELENEQAELERKLLEDEKDIRGRYSDFATNNIVRKVRNEIRANSEILAQKYKIECRTGFELYLNELVRNKLNQLLHAAILHTRLDIEKRYQTNIKSLETLIYNNFESDIKHGLKHVENFFRAIKDTAEISAKEFGDAANTMPDGSIKSKYESISTVLQIVASMVHPWLGIVAKLVPMFLGELEDSYQKKSYEKLLKA